MITVMSNDIKSVHHITGVILSGGAGSRLGGLDKGLQNYKGKALIEHVIEKLSVQVDDLILCVNRNHQQYEQYGYPLVNDMPYSINNIKNKNNPANQSSYQGPVAGITSALKFISQSESTKPVISHSVLVSSCDSPTLPLDYAARLINAMTNNNTSSAVVHDGNRVQNLHCLIHSSAWASLSEFYQNGERAMYQWHKKNGSIEVNFSDQAACFLNLNTTEMLK